MRVAFRLEANDVVADQPVINGLRHVAWQELPAANIGPGNVNELLHDDGRVLLTNHGGSQIEMIVVQHYNWRSLTSLNLGTYRVSDGAIGDTVAIFPGIL